MEISPFVEGYPKRSTDHRTLITDTD